jgi:periplasmic protein CpxP/Spy
LIGGVQRQCLKTAVAGPPVSSGSYRLMMCDLPRPFVCALAVATCLGSIGFVGLSPTVSWAQGAVSGPSGTAAPAPDTGTPPGAPIPENGARPLALDPTAQRINYLHGQLRITPAQEPLWAGLTQVMRDNATALAPLLREGFQATQGGNAIEMLGAGEKLDAAQLDGLRKFIAAFQPLYDSMSGEQKKIADYVFRRSQFSEEPAAPAGILPTYPSTPPPGDYATIPAYPAYPPVYYFPDYSPLFVVPFIGIVAGPRFFFRGRDDFRHLDFHHPDFHALPPPTHVGGGPDRIGAPSFRR